MVKRGVIYVFPFLLVLLEWALRSSLRTDSETFIGPTVAAAGVGLILPLIIPKRKDFGFSQEMNEAIKKMNAQVFSRADQRFIDFAWLFVVICTGAWVYSLYLSCNASNIVWWKAPCYMYPGFGNYFVGVVLTEIKEKL